MIKLSDLQPVVWYVTKYISITKVSDGYIVEKNSPVFCGEQEYILKEYSKESRYWRGKDYESKYDVVYFPSLEEAVEAINGLEFSN